MTTFSDLVAELEALLAEIDALDEPVRQWVYRLLDGIDQMHRAALGRLVASLEYETVAALRRREAAVAWLLDAYGLGVDQLAAAEAALESIRPYIHSHGGKVEVLEAGDGVVSLRLSGACSGCTASAITLKNGIEEALREGFPGFARLEVEEDGAVPHAPPGPTLVQIRRVGA